MAEARKGKTEPRATPISEVVADNTAQTAEADPAEVLPGDEVDRVMGRLIEQATPEQRTELNALNVEGRRELVKTYYAQDLDREPSPLEDDAGNRKPREIRQYKRL